MHVLIADDEKNIRHSLSATFRLDGHTVEAVEDGAEAVRAVERGGVDLLLLDLQMPRMDGLAALRRIRELGYGIPVIFLTAHGSIELAVEAVRLGAFDFLEKPPQAEKLLLCAKNAVRQADLEQENRELRADAEVSYDMIGTSPPMRELFERIRLAAPTEARVLIVGENGTGKELIAHAVHRNSARARGPFVRVNCAAIPRELFESELFGHERGAFTGATARRRGKFLRAQRGTIFLDEVGEIPVELQAKLLRAIETGEIEPVGSERETRADVRVIAATNRDLDAAVAEGRFRQDLYYRLQVVTLTAPPLRQRREDVAPLAAHFLEAACRENHMPARSFDPQALDRLARHDWPGNVRELRNLVERLVILSPGERIGVADVEAQLPARRSDGGIGVVEGGNLHDSMTAFERRVILEALEQHRWRMTATAEALGLERSHLYKKLKALGIERPD